MASATTVFCRWRFRGLTVLFTTITLVELGWQRLNRIQTCFAPCPAPSLHPTSEVRACTCADSDRRLCGLHWCPAALGLMGWHFQRKAKSLAHQWGKSTRHVWTFVCEIRNTETQEAPQIPSTDWPCGINNTYPYTHSCPATDKQLLQPKLLFWWALEKKAVAYQSLGSQKVRSALFDCLPATCTAFLLKTHVKLGSLGSL